MMRGKEGGDKRDAAVFESKSDVSRRLMQVARFLHAHDAYASIRCGVLRLVAISSFATKLACQSARVRLASGKPPNILWALMQCRILNHVLLRRIAARC